MEKPSASASVCLINLACGVHLSTLTTQSANWKCFTTIGSWLPPPRHKRVASFALPYDWEHLISQWEEVLQREISRKRMNPPSLVSTPDDHHAEEALPDLAETTHETDESETDTPDENVTQPTYNIRISVTLPLVKSKQRISGYVYAASQSDVPSALALRRIFPGLKVWSTISLDFGSLVSEDKPFQVKVIEANGPEYRPQLALSTLALDMGSCDPRLPVEAAKLGVPCIGSAQQREQAMFWPELNLEKPDPMMAATLGRQILTDQGVATELCMNARKKQASVLTTTGKEASS